MDSCEFGKEKVQGLTRYIECQETKQPCPFQRYCPTVGHCVNTDCYFAICGILDKKREEKQNGKRV